MNFLVIALSSQLLYYLIIAQTGVVGVFHSQISELYTLPIGGVLGALFSAFRNHSFIRQEFYLLFGIQLAVSWFYPDYSLWGLLLLGFVVGYTTPLMLYVFGSQNLFHLALGMAIAYAFGTFFYTYPFEQRGSIALALPAISMLSLPFAHLKIPPLKTKRIPGLGKIGVMMLWIFADSALFETLSRSQDMDIWSDYTLLIIVSHLAGVFLAYRYGKELLPRTMQILGLFALSYLLYWLHQPILLAVIYPITISYYNVLLFQTLIRIGDVRLIAFATIAAGWIAASAANGVALSHHLWIAAAILGVFGMIYPYYRRIL